MTGYLRLLTHFLILVNSGGFFFASAQSSPSRSSAKLAFDAVSIRQLESSQHLSAPGESTYVSAIHKTCVYSGENVVCQLSLKELIEEAYQLKRYELRGPSWLAEDLFVFKAIVPTITNKEDARLMMQNALEDRFGLHFHFEKKPIPVYEMVATSGGLRLEPAAAPEGQKLLSVGGRSGYLVTMAAGNFSAVAITLDLLATNLGTFADLNRPVLNGTGLEGQYKVDLHWIPTEDPEYLGRFKDPGILDAVKNQLGLVLQKRLLPVDVMVVDKVNRTPSENL